MAKDPPYISPSFHPDCTYPRSLYSSRHSLRPEAGSSRDPGAGQERGNHVEDVVPGLLRTGNLDFLPAEGQRNDRRSGSEGAGNGHGGRTGDSAGMGQRQDARSELSVHGRGLYRSVFL